MRVKCKWSCSISLIITTFLLSYPCVCSTLDPPLEYSDIPHSNVSIKIKYNCSVTKHKSRQAREGDNKGFTSNTKATETWTITQLIKWGGAMKWEIFVLLMNNEMMMIKIRVQLWYIFYRNLSVWSRIANSFAKSS